MAPKNQSATVEPAKVESGETTPKPAAPESHALYEGMTAQEWAKMAETALADMKADHEESGKEIAKLSKRLDRYQSVIGEAMLDLGEFTLEMTKRPIALADRDRLKQAESTIGALSQWLAQQRSAMAKLLVTEYPAIRIIGEKVMFGNGVFAPKGMVYSRELHPNQFAQIVAERLPDIDYVWESSVKS